MTDLHVRRDFNCTEYTVERRIYKLFFPDLGGSMKKHLITALVTPFSNGHIDFSALDKLLDYQLSAKTDGILVLGTTGESNCVDPEERKELISYVRKNTGNTHLMAGCCSNNTAVAALYAKQAQDLGADSILAVTPYYNKCSQQGAYLHFKTIAENTDIPLTLYNVPSRTGFRLSFPTVQRLSEIKNITAVKEAGGDFSFITDLLCKTDLDIYCGEDMLDFPMLSMGCKGLISVVSNVAPHLLRRMCDELRPDKKMIALNKKLTDMCFCETNPIPVKYALSLMGLCRAEYRLPLCPPSDETKSFIRNTLAEENLI